ncbi:MAG: hypothetical protein ACRYG5_14745 [Janthinobacterium lividum]
MKGNFDHIVQALNDEAIRIIGVEPEELTILRNGRLENRAGSHGQYFTTFDFVNGMVRDLACYTLFPMLRMVRAEAVSTDAVRVMFAELSPCYTGFLGYAGFGKLAAWSAALTAEIGTASGEQIRAAVEALNRYVNRLEAWSHHYFPWNAGREMRYAGDVVLPEASRHGIESAAAALTLIRLTWASLGISVRVSLAVDKNVQLCQEVLAALPFEVPQEHAMVSGSSIFAWTPLLSTAPTPHKEVIKDAPLGRVRYSQASGQKITLQYGATSEDLQAPVLGQVVVEDLHLLPALGKAVWESNFSNKNLIMMKAERI